MELHSHCPGIKGTNSYEQSPSYTDSLSDSWEIPYLLWSTKVHYRFRKKSMCA